VKWQDFERAAPELASIARARLEERNLCLIGTVRADGSPRISPVEPYFVDGDLMIGMMWRSRKALDLLRDDRIVVHSTVTDWAGTEGDVKLYGRASVVPIGPRRSACYRAIEAAHGWPVDASADDDPEYHVFAIDIEHAGYVRFGESTWESWTWSPGSGVQKQERPKE
jgi:hypothetical protein